MHNSPRVQRAASAAVRVEHVCELGVNGPQIEGAARVLQREGEGCAGGRDPSHGPALFGEQAVRAVHVDAGFSDLDQASSA